MSRDFSAAEDRAILLAYEEMDADWPAIGAALNRPSNSVKSRYRLLLDTLSMVDLVALKTAEADPTSRGCLRCGSVFLSTGSGNRLCDTCGTANRKVWTFGRVVHEAVSAVRTGVDAPLPPHPYGAMGGV